VSDLIVPKSTEKKAVPLIMSIVLIENAKSLAFDIAANTANRYHLSVSLTRVLIL
jgi:hypothetical protein